MASQSDLIQSLIQKSRPGKRSSIYSICSAHPTVIEAAMLQVALYGVPVTI